MAPSFIENTWEARDTQGACVAVRDACSVSSQPEQNYTACDQPRKICSGSPGVLTPQDGKNAEWRVFFPFSILWPHPTAYRILSSPTHPLQWKCGVLPLDHQGGPRVFARLTLEQKAEAISRVSCSDDTGLFPFLICQIFIVYLLRVYIGF